MDTENKDKRQVSSGPRTIILKPRRRVEHPRKDRELHEEFAAEVTSVTTAAPVTTEVTPIEVTTEKVTYPRREREHSEEYAAEVTRFQAAAPVVTPAEVKKDNVVT